MLFHSTTQGEEWLQASAVLSPLLGQEAHVSPLILQMIFSEPDLQKRLQTEISTISELQVFLTEVKQSVQCKYQATTQIDPTSSELVLGGLKAFWGWMADGFNIVSPERFKKRLLVCYNCPFFQDAGEGLLYDLARKVMGTSPVCGKCGCTIFKKAKIASLSCPLEDPQRPGYTLWGDSF
ncbi:hypothetical protein [Haliscomenobacter sp.]|uniref:hypothetical protein n=1 Tax=Haliscomenobacter sp. TaxID=2717303 RepID=UPI003BAD9A8E